MEQMYLVEIFIDKVTIFVSDEEVDSSANKKLIIKIKFGPKVQFIIKEGQLSPNPDQKDDIVDCDEQGRRKWTRTIRVGKSYLFPSYSDTVLMILSKFPLEIEVWNDDENEIEIFVGIGTMQWDTEFFLMLKETADANKVHEPLSIKQITTLYAECCCRQAGEIAFILRVSALGDSIITEFQQLMKNPELFVFRTNKAPSMFQCNRIEGDDPNFTMVGSLYETTTLEDPDVFSNAQKKIEVCTELQSCGMAPKGAEYSCEHGTSENESKKNIYPINKIRMGDITGPCGNTNCALAHRIRVYLRKLESYKKEAAGKVGSEKGRTTSKICGKCDCKDDKWHRGECPTKKTEEKTEKVKCTGCGGLVNPGRECENKKDDTNVSYMFNTPTYMEAIYGKNYTVQNVNEIKYNIHQRDDQSEPSTSHYPNPPYRCGCQEAQIIALQTRIIDTTSMPGFKIPEGKVSARSIGVSNPVIHNIDNYKRTMSVYNCTDVQHDKDCKCNPPKPKPVCKAPDCECPIRAVNKASRKIHKPYCPSFVHKKNCPVNEMYEDEEFKMDEDEDELEPLPYGLPPIHLGPCPIMGRPCTVPDGFARMYKTAALTPLPPSYSDAGKVCCSKEFARIKKALKEYMTHEKENDFRCINRFNVDTENRCCDKDQKLMSLTGKSCCAPHKISIQEKFKNEKK